MRDFAIDLPTKKTPPKRGQSGGMSERVLAGIVVLGAALGALVSVVVLGIVGGVGEQSFREVKF